MRFCSNINLMLHVDKDTEQIREEFQEEIVDY